MISRRFLSTDIELLVAFQWRVPKGKSLPVLLFISLGSRPVELSRNNTSILEGLMRNNALMVDLARFFKTANHLWGRCPRCGELFRLSEAAISFGNTPPRDWLLRLQRQQEMLDVKRNDLNDWQAELETQEHEVRNREREVEHHERNLESTARALAKDMLKSDKTIKALMKEARQQAILRSRSTLLGKLFERLGPLPAAIRP